MPPTCIEGLKRKTTARLNKFGSRDLPLVNPARVHSYNSHSLVELERSVTYVEFSNLKISMHDTFTGSA